MDELIRIGFRPWNILWLRVLYPLQLMCSIHFCRLLWYIIAFLSLRNNPLSDHLYPSGYPFQPFAFGLKLSRKISRHFVLAGKSILIYQWTNAEKTMSKAIIFKQTEQQWVNSIWCEIQQFYHCVIGFALRQNVIFALNDEDNVRVLKCVRNETEQEKKQRKSGGEERRARKSTQWTRKEQHMKQELFESFCSIIIR